MDAFECVFARQLTLPECEVCVLRCSSVVCSEDAENRERFFGVLPPESPFQQAVAHAQALVERRACH